jgi:hypothetical protein
MNLNHRAAKMISTSLLTLDNDILFEILVTCPNLTTLRSLIITHSALYHAFNNRRRLILRHVFRSQNIPRGSRLFSDQDIITANAYILQLECIDPVDSVALREGLWPDIERLVPDKDVSLWATATLACYHRAGLINDALSFAHKAAGILKTKASLRYPETLKFMKAAIQTYTGLNLLQDAIDLQESSLKDINVLSPYHSTWSKELVSKYIMKGDTNYARQLQRDTWELYAKSGSGSPLALEWARMIVRDYQLQNQHLDALAFHRTVQRNLNPTSAPYIAWSRQYIKMAENSEQSEEVLSVTEEVWRQLDCSSSGYYAWTSQLSQTYDNMKRPGDAIMVCENAWEAIRQRLARNSKDRIWKYRTKLYGLLLAKVYRQHGRIEDATAVEARCSEFDE